VKQIQIVLLKKTGWVLTMDDDLFSIDLMTWIWRIFIVVIICMYILVFTGIYLSKDIDTSKVEMNSFENRLLFSSDCLVENKIGLIKLNKFNDERISECFKKNNFEFEINLYDLSNKKIKSAKTVKRETSLAPVCESLPKCSKDREYVLFEEGGKIKQGILEIILVENV